MNAMTAMVGWMLRRSRVGLFALLLGIALFELIQPVALSSFGDLAKLTPFLAIVPPSFWAMLNVTPDFLSGSGAAGYLSLGFTHPVFIILSSTTVIWFTCRGLAGEMERGTIQFMLSRSVSRERLYASRLIGTLLVVTLVAAIGPIGMAVGLAASPPEGTVQASHLVTTGLAVWALGWAIGGCGLLGSAAASSMGRAIGWAIGALLVSYVIDYFGNLWSALEPLQPISIFHYYDPANALANGTLALSNLAVLVAVGLAGSIAGVLVFTRRDLPV